MPLVLKISVSKSFYKKIGLLSLLFFLITIQLVTAQSYVFKAWLYEADSFSRVPFAVVSIKNKMTATTSDETGYFELVCDMKDTLVVGHITYIKMYIPIKNLVDYSKGKIMIYLKRKEVELVPVTISGKRLTNEKKEEYQRHLERVRPSISNPISMIYESLSRRGKERSQMDEIYSELLLRDQLETRLPPRKLFLITNDRSVKLDDLLMLCPVSSYFVLNASDYDFFLHFSGCWDEYKKRR
ncbi:MAG: hypothetical protein ACKVQB_04190 [Bacteroidia bacterium]